MATFRKRKYLFRRLHCGNCDTAAMKGQQLHKASLCRVAFLVSWSWVPHLIFSTRIFFNKTPNTSLRALYTSKYLVLFKTSVNTFFHKQGRAGSMQNERTRMVMLT